VVDLADEPQVPPPFIVFSLPRSRSAWMTHFLSYSPFQCGHDIATHCSSVSDFLGHFGDGMVGTCETGAVEAWRVIRAEMSECKFVVVRRPVSEVLASFYKLGLFPDPQIILDRAGMLESVAALPNTLVLDYSELAGQLGCRRLFEFCLELPFDHNWWEYYAGFNIQVDVEAQLRLTESNSIRLREFRAEVAHRTAGLALPREFH